MTYDARVPLGQLHRVMRGFTQVDSRMVPKAHIHDPRRVPTVSPKRRNADLVAQWRLKEAWARNGMTPLHVLQQSSASQDLRYPLQVQNAAFSVLVSTPITPKILIPRNKNRMTWSITNFTEPGTEIYWSYGYPPLLEGGLLGGNALLPGAPPHMESGNTVAIDAIYVFCRAAALSYVIGFEGTVAPEANQS